MYALPTLIPLIPEFVLGLGAMTLLMLGVHRGEAGGRTVDIFAILLLVVAGIALVVLPSGKLTTFGGSFVVDDFARFLKILALIGSAAAIALSLDYAQKERQQRAPRICGAAPGPAKIPRRSTSRRGIVPSVA